MSDTTDNVWILGAYMTKFGRHTDKDLIDLASEAATGALTDAGVTIHDMGVLGAGSLFNAQAGDFGNSCAHSLAVRSDFRRFGDHRAVDMVNLTAFLTEQTHRVGKKPVGRRTFPAWIRRREMLSNIA